jgi:hypothetical protein
MTDDIGRMLAAACEDRPAHASIDAVVRRGRRRVRLRRSGGAVFSVLAVGGVLAALTALPTGGPSPSPSDQEVINRCEALDDEFVASSSDSDGGGTDPINDWSVAVKQTQDTWTRAILVSPDEERYAYCMSDLRGLKRDYYREAVDHRVGFSDVTLGQNGAEGQVPDGVTRLTFMTPDGTVSEATIANGFFLWYSSRSDWGVQPVRATFYDADGNLLKQLNVNPATATAPSCLWRMAGDELVCSTDAGTVLDRLPRHNEQWGCDWQEPAMKDNGGQSLYCVYDVDSGAGVMMDVHGPIEGKLPPLADERQH